MFKSSFFYYFFLGLYKPNLSSLIFSLSFGIGLGNSFLLKSYMNENYHIDYFYNERGIRYKKVVDNIEINYILDGTKILKEYSKDYEIKFIYNLNKLIGFKYNEEEFIYERNIFGDISRIYSSSGELVGEYLYDACGNVTITKDINGIASNNPFRYRGYYYYKETNLYYCNARYYSPYICRWLSMDSIKYLDSNNINGLLNPFQLFQIKELLCLLHH